MLSLKEIRPNSEPILHIPAGEDPGLSAAPILSSLSAKPTSIPTATSIQALIPVSLLFSTSPTASDAPPQLPNPHSVHSGLLEGVDSSFSDLPLPIKIPPKRSLITPHESDSKRRRIQADLSPYSGVPSERAQPCDGDVSLAEAEAASVCSCNGSQENTQHSFMDEESDRESEPHVSPTTSASSVTTHVSDSASDSGVGESLSDSCMTLPEQGTKHLTPKFQRLWPSGIKEQRRFNSQAHLLYAYMHKKRICQLEIPPSSQNLAAIGRGNQPFAEELCHTHPSAKVVSVDFEYSSSLDWCPTNLSRQVDNLFKEWTWPKDHFDTLLIYNCNEWMNKKKSRFFLQECLKALKPGRPMEFTWFSWLDMKCHGSERFDMWQRVARAGANKAGISPPTAAHLESSGFELVSEKHYNLHLRPVEGLKEFQVENQLDFIQAVVEAYSAAFIAGMMDWQRESVDIICGQVRTDLAKKGFNLPVVVLRAQKPCMQ